MSAAPISTGLAGLATATELSIDRMVSHAIGGGEPRKSSLWPMLWQRACDDARAGRLPLLSEVQSGSYGNSVVSRGAALAWLKAQGATVPAALAAPRSLEEALALIGELAAELATLRAANALR